MEITVKTLYGLEDVVAGELGALGIEGVEKGNRAVTFEGGREQLYGANYMLRSALSILVKVGGFYISSRDDLYRGALKIDWSSLMSENDTFSVTPVVNSPLFQHTAYPGLVVKDAIADHFRTRSGRRPSVNSAHPRISVNLHISNKEATLSVDSSVLPLFKRGYRKLQAGAPLNESLAAGIIMLTGWRGDSDFYDPMCGSGTFPIEAGLIAAAIPPGFKRDFYGFMNWRDYDSHLFMKVRERYNRRIRPVTVKIGGSDISMRAVRAARDGVIKAGLEGDVRINREDFSAPFNVNRSGIVLFNPPYGKRIVPDELELFYKSTGRVLKHHYVGCDVWILSGAAAAMKHLGLRPSSRQKLYNGSIECTLNNYKVMEGSFRK